MCISLFCSFKSVKPVNYFLLGRRFGRGFNEVFFLFFFETKDFDLVRPENQGWHGHFHAATLFKSKEAPFVKHIFSDYFVICDLSMSTLGFSVPPV